MNRVRIPASFLKKWYERTPTERDKQRLRAVLERLQKDPTSNTTVVPFKGLDDVRIVPVDDYFLVFKFDSKDSVIYPLAFYQNE